MSGEILMFFQTNYVQPYNRRMIKELLPIFGLAMLTVAQLFVMIYWMETPFLFNIFFPGLFIALGIFDYSRAYRNSRYYITKLYLDGNDLVIEYVVKNKMKFFKNPANSFTLKMNGLILGKRGKFSAPELVFYHKDGEFMRQGIFGSWNREEIYRVYDLMTGTRAFQREIALTGVKPKKPFKLF